MDARLGAIRFRSDPIDRGEQPDSIVFIRPAAGGASIRSGARVVVGVFREPCSNGVQEAPSH